MTQNSAPNSESPLTGAANQSTHEENFAVDVPQTEAEKNETFGPHHPREGVASLEFRHQTAEELAKQDAEEGKVKHIWDGEDLWMPKDGSWWYSCNRPTWFNGFLMFFLVVCGLFEGFLFVKVGIVNPLAITTQFRFETWIVMKIFLSVIGSSMIFQSIFDFVSPSFFNETRATRYIKHGYARVMIGGGLLGAGSLICGSGPTIVPAQLGANVHNVWVAALGMLVGGVIIYFMNSLWLAKYEEKIDEHTDRLTIDEKLGVRYYKLGLPMGIFMFGFACALEFAIPGTTTKDDAKRLGMNVDETWPAIVAGVWVAFTSLLFRFIAHHGAGGSTSILVWTSLLTWGKVAPNNFPNSFSRTWQWAYVWFGLTAGAVLAAQVYKDTFAVPAGLNEIRYFFGGVFVIVGAKLGNGCLCGASMVGSSEFGFEQFLQTAASFAVGIPLAFIFKAAGVPAVPDKY